MATKSNNTQGNPWHDEDGKFTSEGDGSVKNETLESPGLKLKAGVSLDQLNKNNLVLKGNLKLKGDKKFDDIVSRLNDINQVSNIPKLSSASDIEQHIEEFFSKEVTQKIDSMYGNSQGCASYQFHPKANPRVSLNLFTCVLGKYRYKDNHAHMVNVEEQNQLRRNPNFNLTAIYRGITSTGEKRRNILKSYVTMDLNNLDIYGNGMYGTNVYTTVDYNYAYGYAGSPDNVIKGYLNTKGAYSLTDGQLYNIGNSLSENNIRDKVKNKLLQNGLPDDRATRISKSFAKSVTSDISLVAILLGVDFQVSEQHQRNILNLSRWYIREENN